VEQYLCECPPEADSDEMTYLRAMQQATYAMIVVESVERGVGCRVLNMFTDETRLLVDMRMSQTAQRGLAMATRLLDFGGYVATGGAALTIGVLDDQALDLWQRKLSTGVHVESYDPAPLIRECLERDAASHIQYAGTEAPGQFELEVDESSPAIAAPARQRRSSAKRKSTKPAANRRCGCGSGKMFKNCCGKGSVIRR
jgi:hypothetical protein